MLSRLNPSLIAMMFLKLRIVITPWHLLLVLHHLNLVSLKNRTRSPNDCYVLEFFFPDANEELSATILSLMLTLKSELTTFCADFDDKLDGLVMEDGLNNFYRLTLSTSTFQVINLEDPVGLATFLCDGLNFQGMVPPTFTLISKRTIYFENFKVHFTSPIDVAQEKLKLDEHRMQVVMSDFGITVWPHRDPSPINPSESKGESSSWSSKDTSSQNKSVSGSSNDLSTSSILGKRKHDDSPFLLVYDCPHTGYQLMVTVEMGMQFSKIVEEIADTIKCRVEDIEHISYPKGGSNCCIRTDNGVKGLLAYMNYVGMEKISISITMATRNLS